MGSLALTMLIVVVIGFICILLTPKSSAEPPVAWACSTCGASNPPDAAQCGECGMDPQA